ncbi:MAG: hypothetical protein HY690_16795 [Chloroflexi bacterium]|nr:hypothetical protein [Chloroflexota bacterium]
MIRALARRQYLSSAAAIALAGALAVLLLRNQAYLPTYQTFPLVDWLEFTFGPDDAARFGSAEAMAWRMVPLLESYSVETGDYQLPVQFSEHHLARKVSGLESSHALRLATPAAQGGGGERERTGLDGKLELRVFHNGTRARTYAGLRTLQLDTMKGIAEVAPRAEADAYRVWVSYQLLPQDGGAATPSVQVIVVGQTGPAAYEVALRSQRPAGQWTGNAADLVDWTQTIAEALAGQWRRLMQEARTAQAEPSAPTR